MEIIEEFISTYGATIIYTILTAVITFIGTKIKDIYEKNVTDETKRKVVKTVVNAVEQLYKDLKGKEKFEKAKKELPLTNLN